MEVALLKKLAFGASMLSGVTGYMGAKAQADQLDANAEAVLDKSEVDAITHQRKIQDETQQIAFQKSLIEYNKNQELSLFTSEIQGYEDSFEEEIAKGYNTMGYGGTFTAVLDAAEMKANEKLQTLYTEKYDEFLSLDMQSDEYDRQMLSITEIGKSETAMIRHTGSIQALQLQQQADNTKLAGKSAMLGTFASAAMGYAMIS
tara:strand:+ start:682 stop:1290 length:609 start_codon:yes stop_codon:yes gene_type:complete